MNTNSNAPTTGATSQLQVARVNRVQNIEGIEPRLPNYGEGENGMPVTVSFHQEFKKKETIAVVIEEDEIKTEKKVIDGKEVSVPVLEPKERTLNNGKKITVFMPVLTGNKLKKKSRIETGGELNDKRRHDLFFICSDPKEMRKEIGEALTEFYGILASENIFARSQKVNVTFNFGGKVLSTKHLSYGGIKLSKVFKKGILQKDLYSEQFCKPLFNQLKSVASGENNKPLEIDDAILSAIGLTKK